MTPLPPQLALTRSQAAKACSVSVDTIDRAIASGELPVRRFGRLVRISVQALNQWVNNGKHSDAQRKANAVLADAGIGETILGGAGLDGREIRAVDLREIERSSGRTSAYWEAIAPVSNLAEFFDPETAPPFCLMRSTRPRNDRAETV